MWTPQHAFGEFLRNLTVEQFLFCVPGEDEFMILAWFGFNLSCLRTSLISLLVSPYGHISEELSRATLIKWESFTVNAR